MGDMADYYAQQELADDFARKDMEKMRRLRMNTNLKHNTRRTLGPELQTNKFYVGSHLALDRAWGHPTIEAAVEHAKNLIEETGSDQFIVEIVRLVRRKNAPVEVKTVPAVKQERKPRLHPLRRTLK
jgi:hypothetical protein